MYIKTVYAMGNMKEEFKSDNLFNRLWNNGKSKVVFITDKIMKSKVYKSMDKFIENNTNLSILVFTFTCVWLFLTIVSGSIITGLFATLYMFLSYAIGYLIGTAVFYSLLGILEIGTKVYKSVRKNK